MLLQFVINATIHILITVTVVLAIIVFVINVEVMVGSIIREKLARKSKSKTDCLTKVWPMKL